MKVLILAGGLGTRLGEETSVRPKPMVGIGGKPILWHIMKTYSHSGSVKDGLEQENVILKIGTAVGGKTQRVMFDYAAAVNFIPDGAVF